MYGKVEVSRHVYQSHEGGKIYVPMEARSGIIGKTTPRFAKIISHKYAQLTGGQVVDDLEESHNRKVSLDYVQNVADRVGGIMAGHESEWTYDLPKLKEEVASISIGVDGANAMVKHEGWKQVMSGTVALYNSECKLLHTIYVANGPESGKKTFYGLMDTEIAAIKNVYPQAYYVGLADGSKDNWTYLAPHVEATILDFYHVTEHVAIAAKSWFGSQEAPYKEWLEEAAHELKNKANGASRLLNDFIKWDKEKPSEAIKNQITYFQNNRHRMNYKEYEDKSLPIGSGVTESACKILVKQRLCGAGMKWTINSIDTVLMARTLIYSKRWNQFWHNHHTATTG